jgi:myo-inositol-1-phosphate synthase
VGTGATTRATRRGGIGVWLVGGRGSVATTTVTGAAAIAAGLAPPTGLITALPAFDACRALPPIGDLVFGGHDLVDTTMRKRAEELAIAGVLPAMVPGAVGDALDAADAAIRPGIDPDAGEPPREAIRRVQGDLDAFVTGNRLDGLVMIDCSTTEAPVPADPAHATLAGVDRALDAGRDVLPPSSLYAYAALDAGWPFVAFTPSTGARLPALEELAAVRRVPHAGCDGKTGETLVKAALAAMFADRNLMIRSWSGTNLLGGGDGASLAGAGPAESKRRSKAVALQGILGWPVEGDVHIAHVPDLGEWKTAWDLVTFEGFLGARMRLQFTWEGADSALAAPLLLDLARLLRAAHASGRIGAQPALAFFFKDPVPGAEHRLDRQIAELVDWALGL